MLRAFATTLLLLLILKSSVYLTIALYQANSIAEFAFTERDSVLSLHHRNFVAKRQANISTSSAVETSTASLGGLPPGGTDTPPPVLGTSLRSTTRLSSEDSESSRVPVVTVDSSTSSLASESSTEESSATESSTLVPRTTEGSTVKSSTIIDSTTVETTTSIRDSSTTSTVPTTKSSTMDGSTATSSYTSITSVSSSQRPSQDDSTSVPVPPDDPTAMTSQTSTSSKTNPQPQSSSTTKSTSQVDGPGTSISTSTSPEVPTSHSTSNVPPTTSTSIPSTTSTSSHIITTSDTLICSSGKYRCAKHFGGGCCPSDYECSTSMCVAPPITSFTVTCDQGLFLCPKSLGGGCCPSGRICARTTCGTMILTSRPVTITGSPQLTTLTDGEITTQMPIPIVTITVDSIIVITESVTVIKEEGSTMITIPTRTGVPQTPPQPPEASNARKLSGGAIGGIAGGGIVAILILLSAVIFTWRRLTGRGNFELPSAFGAAGFYKRRRRSRDFDDAAVTSGSYDPQSPGGKAHRQRMRKETKFGRSGSGASGGGGYRGTTVTNGNNGKRGSDGFCPPGTTVSGSDGNKSLTSATKVTVNPINTPSGSPPAFHESDGFVVYQPYNTVQQDPYIVELDDGEPSPLPVQRWLVTNPDVETESVAASRVPSRAGDRVQLHPGTNF